MPGKNRILIFIFPKSKRNIAIIAALVIVSICTVIFAQISSNPLSGKSIIIDPGHGGIDGGAWDGRNFLEKDVNLQISLKLKDKLTEDNVNISMTRDSDVSLDGRNTLSSSRHARDLMERVNLINSGNYDIFVSIHVNNSKNASAIGPMVLYSSKQPASAILATCIQNSLNRHSESALTKYAVHSPVKSEFFILNNSSIPGVIVESGFISNPTEKRLLQDPSYQSRLCSAIYSGLRDFFTGKDKRIIDENRPHNDESIPLNLINQVRLVRK